MTNVAIILSVTKREDLDTLFLFQLNEEANYLAAFTSKDYDNKTAYIAKYSKFLADPTKNTQTIRIKDEIVGSIAKFVIEGNAEITYWIDRKYWGQGIATKALNDFLKIEQKRPIHGRVAFDNYASQKVLEKCGFVRIGTDKGFAYARQAEIEEYIYRLSD